MLQDRTPRDFGCSGVDTPPQKRGNKRLQKNNGVNRSMESKPMERDRL